MKAGRDFQDCWIMAGFDISAHKSIDVFATGCSWVLERQCSSQQVRELKVTSAT